MKRLVAKKNFFYLAASLVATVIFWFGFVQPQQAVLSQKTKRLQEIQNRSAVLQTNIGRALAMEKQFRNSERAVRAYEAAMPPQEISLWIVTNITSVQALRVELVNDAYDERHLESLYYWPYKSVFFSFKGFGTYNQLTAFVIELEQKMPFMKITSVNSEVLEASRTSRANAGQNDTKFQFQVNIYALVRAYDDSVGAGNLPMRQARASF